MKNILLTSTALVAFAGAAAAGGHTSVSFGGEASANYNTLDGYATAAEMTASASATLDNGLTASTSFTLETANFGSGEFGAGSVSLSSDTASLTFGTAVVGAIRSAVGDAYAVGTGDDVAFVDGEIAGIAASATFGETTLLVSVQQATGTAITGGIEVGVTTSAAGWDIGLGLDQAAYAMTAAGTAGGATVGFGMSSDSEWDVSVAYPVGAVTVSASTDEANAWEVGAAYAADGVSAGIVLSPANAWEISAGYDADGIVVAATFASDNSNSIGATYAMGSLTVGAGMETTAASVTTNYAFGSFDLGGGANAFAEYANGAQVEVGPSERDIAEGTTVGVSFTF